MKKQKIFSSNALKLFFIKMKRYKFYNKEFKFFIQFTT